MHTKNPNTEAMRTLQDLIDNPVTNPYTIDIVAQNAPAADALVERLKTLPTVSQVRDIDSFVPQDQDKKLALIADARSILAATLAAAPPAAPITADQVRMAARVALSQIEPALPKLPKDSPLTAVATDLHRLADASDAVALEANAELTRFLPLQLDHLRASMSAGKVTRADIPPDIARDWVLPDGRARLQVLPKPDLGEGGLKAFVAQVIGVAPDAGGSAVTIVSTSATIVGAFRTAAVEVLLVAILLILWLILRRPLDVMLVAAPLVLSALQTLYVAVLFGLQLNFANIIALPLLLGVGVSFNVYFIMNWRAGRILVLGSANGAGSVVFGPYDRHRIWFAGIVRSPGNREHGCIAADQSGLHAARQFGVCAVGFGRSGLAAAAELSVTGSTLSSRAKRSKSPAVSLVDARLTWKGTADGLLRADLLSAAPGSG